MTLQLVRHGRPRIDPDRPAAEWGLDPAGYDDVWALRDRLPAAAAWYSSPEPKALQTAELLTDGDIGVVDGLREQRRGGWVEDFEEAVRQAFAEPDAAARPGWEPLAACRDRVLGAVRPILAAHEGEDVVLVGHGTAWTVLAAALRGGAGPRLRDWETLRMPDLLVVEPPR